METNTPPDDGSSKGRKPSKKATPKYTPVIPSRHVELLDRGKAACDAWSKDNKVVLFWTNAAQFDLELKTAAATFSGRLKVGSGRGGVTRTLEQLDEEIDRQGIQIIKSALITKYHTEAASRYHFPKFGIKSVRGKYVIPKERSARLAALNLIKESIVSEGFSDLDFGATYWAGLYNTYSENLALSELIDKSVSTSVGAKNQQAANIRETLQSLVLAIRANYRKESPSVLKGWGFYK